MIPRRVLLCCILLTICIVQYATAVSVSLVLQDDVTVRNNTITHSLKAFKEIQNVTMIDYFSNVKTENSAKENFLGKEFEAVKIEIGDLIEGESRSVSYSILGGNGTAMLGADIYYLNGEKHRLFPKEIEIEIKEKPVKEEINTNLLIIVFLIILIFTIVYLKLRK